MRFRKGDIVDVRCKVQYDQMDDTSSVTIDVQYGGHVPADRVTMVTPHFDDGETATIIGSDAGEPGTLVTVLSSHDGHCWVRMPSGGLTTVHATELCRDEPPVTMPKTPPIQQ